MQLDQNILQIIKPRPTNSHKGNFGRVLIIAGSTNFAGAAIMSAKAAVYSGAGLVTLATDPKIFSAINSSIPEVMTLDYNYELTEDIQKSNVILIGPGLADYACSSLLKQVVKRSQSHQTVIVDATALNHLTPELLAKIKAQVILTPHQMEWQRLSKIKIDNQNDETNLTYLNQFETNPILVLKSHQTTIYYDDQIFQNIPGNPGMATGGSGDTLAGIIAGFTAQFDNRIETISAAVFTHSDIANDLFNSNYVVLPELLIKELPSYMKKHQK
ncbi:NAD(P)H-hydrate dehydratase [Lactobacillus sp. YT155]|uniref:NAD(P)H-hydrate dehydratase n=1 Tax=Lactobacillus sp. YT155 TaxID=3060955 RepID=UPI00265F08ED|nr:NAD(P)H-hydrate dehydratase [Lactobacillus sp. YT155]MDO1605646.1 NAD(P)H-hydrate dehydratase [Lactobacillus sp. YT155]